MRVEIRRQPRETYIRLGVEISKNRLDTVDGIVGVVDRILYFIRRIFNIIPHGFTCVCEIRL